MYRPDARYPSRDGGRAVAEQSFTLSMSGAARSRPPTRIPRRSATYGESGNECKCRTHFILTGRLRRCCPPARGALCSCPGPRDISRGRFHKSIAVNDRILICRRNSAGVNPERSPQVAVQESRAREARWDAVTSESPPLDAPPEWAVAPCLMSCSIRRWPRRATARRLA
jgi:hypothetical protein